MQTAQMNVTVQSSTTIPVSSSTVATTVSSSIGDTTVKSEQSEDDNQTKPDKTTVDTLISSVENQIKMAESDNSSGSTVLILVIVLIIIFIVGGVLGVYYRYMYKKEYLESRFDEQKILLPGGAS